MLTEEQRQRVRDAIAEALGDAYDCTRVWSAWGVGTMGPDDFALVAEDESRLEEIVEAAIDAMPAPSLTYADRKDWLECCDKSIDANVFKVVCVPAEKLRDLLLSLPAQPRFPQTYCSQCGRECGPGDEGVSHCGDHK